MTGSVFIYVHVSSIIVGVFVLWLCVLSYISLMFHPERGVSHDQHSGARQKSDLLWLCFAAEVPPTHDVSVPVFTNQFLSLCQPLDFSSE